jgi:TrmH family RNA methyltransferase
MISKKWLKLIHSLQIKKYRKQHQAFLVEGAKSVLELISSDYKIIVLFVTQEFFNENIRELGSLSFSYEIVSQEELEKTGAFQSNNASLAVVSTKPNDPLHVSAKEYSLMLDDIKDPGNLGTIIRIADWYGITKIICSHTTTDIYNPKVISASMGSFTRVRLYYCDLADYLASNTHIPVYGAFLSGQNIHTVSFASHGIIVMGNESQGISADLERFIREKIHIPRYGKAESLNAGIATAIILDNLRRGNS